MSNIVAMQVSNCTKGISGNKSMLLAAMMALFTCEEHNGVHHFAVINDGEMLVVSETAIGCLKKQGVEL